MAIDEPWARKEHFEKHGTWPMTSRQEKEAIARNKRSREFQESLGGPREVIQRANAYVKKQQENERKNQLPIDFD